MSHTNFDLTGKALTTRNAKVHLKKEISRFVRFVYKQKCERVCFISAVVVTGLFMMPLEESAVKTECIQARQDVLLKLLTTQHSVIKKRNILIRN